MNDLISSVLEEYSQSSYKRRIIVCEEFFTVRYTIGTHKSLEVTFDTQSESLTHLENALMCLLGRKPEVEEVRGGRFVVAYFNYNTKPPLPANTVLGAYRNMIDLLLANHTLLLNMEVERGQG